ncbi:33 kDa inner dynein arm light chain, axonemal [Histomonas meleagridis]|uniref:33 kDa inner dynein arm light chain, axonemal n=1 Tax=Histomonas meleagridis TaxID=135588 RepID=UPI00355A5D6E|nr:33 kDa inner dynein arm light chain, axonemal [Histomonas meleagridis]KAH0803437.1 33 kDa inner dynein arm light chain, axonemal [Histomonas meleagridis]
MELKRNELLKWDPPVSTEGKDQNQTQKKKIGSSSYDNMNRDVINSMFPPIEFEEDGITYRQNVSTSAATKSDVIKLKEQFQSLLQTEKAKNNGICMIRSELYSQCFDEIIRQVTVDCNPRGKLLMRIRKHYRTTLDAYKDLYNNSLDWGNRKAKLVELEIPELESRNAELKDRLRTLELKANDLHIKLDNLEKKLAENRSLREKDYADEIAFLKRLGQMTKAQIDMLDAQK